MLAAVTAQAGGRTEAEAAYDFTLVAVDSSACHVDLRLPRVVLERRRVDGKRFFCEAHLLEYFACSSTSVLRTWPCPVHSFASEPRQKTRSLACAWQRDPSRVPTSGLHHFQISWVQLVADVKPLVRGGEVFGQRGYSGVADEHRDVLLLVLRRFQRCHRLVCHRSEAKALPGATVREGTSTERRK